MKPWEVEETVRQLRNTDGAKTVEVGLQLTEAALRILSDSIRNENPKITHKKLHQEIERIVWELRPWIMRTSLKVSRRGEKKALLKEGGM